MEKAFITLNVGDLVKEYLDSLTNSNAHGERLREIAELCAVQADEQGHGVACTIFSAYAVDLAKINREHDKAGHLTQELYERREYIRGRMRTNIRGFFGTGALEELNP